MDNRVIIRKMGGQWQFLPAQGYSQKRQKGWVDWWIRLGVEHVHYSHLVDFGHEREHHFPWEFFLLGSSYDTR